MAASTRQTRRGPKPNPNRGTPSGYRIDARTRFEMQMAASFVGTQSLQDTIGVAVGEFLAGMHGVPGFSEALRNAEQKPTTARGRCVTRGVQWWIPDRAGWRPVGIQAPLLCDISVSGTVPVPRTRVKRSRVLALPVSFRKSGSVALKEIDYLVAHGFIRV